MRKGESQKFWLSLLSDVMGVEHASEVITFEDQVHLDHTSFIDGSIPETHVLIEQKSLGKSLTAAIRQSDGSMLSPIQQALRYVDALLREKGRQAVPRWIVTCNFEEFRVYDMDHPQNEAQVIRLADLEKECHRLKFLVDTGSEALRREMEISLDAGRLVGKLYDALLKQYKDPAAERTLKSLNALCVRLVFCLYAEDAGIFGHLAFHDYIKAHTPQQTRKALVNLFRVLDQKPKERDPYLADDDPLLAAFPYVNGGLFRDENIEIPPITDEIHRLLLRDASEDFDWSEISPTIFGAVFESTLNPETRRSGGMHYTSIENIHKVIDPLFLDELTAELEAILADPVQRTRVRRLEAYQDKLASLEFLDPAAGSGNFLTESYLCLRKLENRAILGITGGQIVMGIVRNPIKVSITQFHGIEINDFAVTVARTALWIAESQMMKQTEDIVHMQLDFLPLKTAANIVEGNALRLDWADVVEKDKLNYIMGNPPFVGHQWRSRTQAEDMEIAFHDLKKHGKLDYVSAWYNKAADYICGTQIKVAFVSTNSICQGESVGILWSFLFEYKKIEIQFAYRSFSWSSESVDSATVHCVIIGFTSYHSVEKKALFDGSRESFVEHINGYLIGAPDVFIQSRGKPRTAGFPEMTKGSQPTDGGYLILSENERQELVANYPNAEKMIKRYISADDYINNKYRYCLWLKGVSPSEYRGIKPIMDRLEKVAECRRKSPTVSVRRDADIPMLFTQIRQPRTQFLSVPEVSSEKRKYIPIGYLSPDIIGSNKLYMIPDASLYMFGVLISNVHMAWMRVIAGRLELRYSYSPAVYNNFPWPTPTDAQRAKIEQTAQAILDARALYPEASLADLYDELTMPPELRRAHQQNDRAVMEAYGLPVKTTTESSCVAHLMKLYQELTSK